ncbi:MAG: hypothetical protein ABFD12_09865 [Syntrophorhabdus sp.]
MPGCIVVPAAPGCAGVWENVRTTGICVFPLNSLTLPRIVVVVCACKESGNVAYIKQNIAIRIRMRAMDYLFPGVTITAS